MVIIINPVCICFNVLFGYLSIESFDWHHNTTTLPHQIMNKYYKGTTVIDIRVVRIFKYV